MLRQNGFKSTTKPLPAPASPTFGAVISVPHAMSKLPDFFRKYRQYIGTEVLMYGTFILILVVLVVFFG
jgi:hypothetical protein